MPTYDYECGKCGHRYEKFQSITADKDTACPECGKTVKRLIGSGAGIIMKSVPGDSSRARVACPAESPCCGERTCPKFD